MKRAFVIGSACLVVAVVSYVAVYHYFISDEPYKAAVTFISKHPAVVAELGPVRNVGLSWFASFSISGSSGEADIECPVTGEKRDGTVSLNLKRVAGTWSVSDATLLVDGERRIPLHGEQ